MNDIMDLITHRGLENVVVKNVTALARVLLIQTC